MPQSLAFNADCMEALRQMNDNEFDLAVVDPPYGSGIYDGGAGWFGKYTKADSQSVHVEREREPARSGTASVVGLTSTRKPVRRGGWHGKDKYHLGTSLQLRSQEEIQHLPEQAGRGQRSTQKNHIVGRGAGTGIFRGAVPRLTESDYMGR